ncbi:GNAT family N-acetyltransferase [Streptomyces sp. NPDC051567]|uniref:GNAT family N-acetyltransferase n=1 Tax=Streptomyces sp. NPDC051567 TaxID=3365660 RepID=UPI00378A4D6A
MTVLLRHLRADDAPHVRRVYRGGSVRYLGRGEMTRAEAERYVTQAHTWAHAEPVVRHVLGIEAGRHLVGVAKLRRYPSGEGRVGYVLREDTWGNGYATEAVRRLVAFAFSLTGTDRLTARHLTENTASGRVLLKSGFECVGPQGDYVHYRCPNP